ncbi:MAG: hypothetical protein R3281_00790, partial [Balneolaceae bacterium]|nr:hypothetical protein [Balneolaceae bacterium]
MLEAAIKTYFHRLLAIGAAGVLLAGLLLLVIPVQASAGLLAGYLLSFLFVTSNFFVVRKLDLEDQKKFLTLFFTSIAARFVL